MKPTVFIVDDEELVRKAVSRLLRSEDINVSTFASPVDFLAAYDPKTTGCLLLDLHMPTLNGLQLQKMILSKGGDLPIIFLSGRADIPVSVQAMKQGASDFLTKPVSDDVLLAAVKAAFAKHLHIQLERGKKAEIATRLSSLTPRELEVLGHVTKGRLNKQIANDLGTVEKTVKVHRARVMEKMKVQSVAELVRLTLLLD
jgi:FixJ family two-component response regulator